MELRVKASRSICSTVIHLEISKIGTADKLPFAFLFAFSTPPLKLMKIMTVEDTEKLNAGIRDVPDFPKPGIIFKDITPVLGDPELLKLTIDGFIETAGGQRVDKVAGIDARGFIFGAAIADRIGAGFVPIRKKGKLPWKTQEMSYALEYGDAEIEIHDDAVLKGETVLLVDDLLATGGTAAAAAKLLEGRGANIIGATFLIELEFLRGREAMDAAFPIHALLKY